MKSDFLIAITQLAAEKNLSREVVFAAVEQALASAYKKEGIGEGATVVVKITPATGDLRVFTQHTVVEEPTDPLKEVSLKDARKIRNDIQVGDVLEVETTPKNAGRIAAQTAKQVVLQRLREAEREHVYEEYISREGDIVSGTLSRIEPKQIVVDLGNAEAILPISEQVRGERYRVGQRLRFYVMEVSRSTRGAQVVLSRAHKNLLRRLLELEVPEIFNGLVEIKGLAREPGHRSKVAVAARQEGLDPVGACIGMRGIRIQNIVNELDGERIDIIQWQPETAAAIASALSPAQVTRVEIDEATHTAVVIVPDRQLSLAIGREGQNARLAAKLTGWRIDIKSVTAAEEERLARVAAAAEPTGA
ncbi:MAG: transcription termination/antitermination protein NusA, partial [Chloroflexi bacterium]|nr:transcription termination/antitermination protein NusA [Chloroflexota bacterium]